MRDKWKIVCVGAGYFAPYHLEAWSRIPEVELVALCDSEISKANEMAARFGIVRTYETLNDLLGSEQPDLVDIITPPESHLSLVDQIARKGIHMICQKPFAPSMAEAEAMVEVSKRHEVRLFVHENFRFQPWHRKIKSLLKGGLIGDKIHSISFRMRTGDGWQTDAYQARQPYFRDMPRFLVFETGIHFIDVFRFLGGEIISVYADLRRLNQEIAGEDEGLVVFGFADGARGVWDANRYNEPNYPNPRLTFGEMMIEGTDGTIRLYPDGQITHQRLGQTEKPVEYIFMNENFGGDCVYFTQRHIIKSLLRNERSEIEGENYITNLEIQEAIYESADCGKRIDL